MNVIISKSLQDNFTQFVLVDSFKKACTLNGITTIVIHSYTDSEFDAGVFISQLRELGVKQFFYINSEPSTTIKMVLKGVQGYFFEDEFYFEDEEELISLIEDVTVSEEEEDEFTSIAAPALNTIATFMKSFVAGDKLVQTPLYLEQVEGAISELQEVTHKQELQISAMGSSALAVFEKASQIIKNMDNQRKLIEKQLEELEQNQGGSSSKPAFGNNIMFFSPYKYIGNTKVLQFREYAPCRYLTSFVLGYTQYLHYVRNKRVKVIFVVQKGQGVSAKYKDFTFISEETKNMMSLYDAEIVATNSPKKEVLKDLLSIPVEICIVVDRLYGMQDIISGRVTTIPVVSSASDVRRYGVKAKDCIFSVTRQPEELFTIPTIKNFPREQDARLAVYNQIMESAYKKIDAKLGII